MNKKAVMEDISKIVIGVFTFSVVLVITLLILAQSRTQVETMESSDWCGTGFAYSTSGNNCCNTTGGTANCLGANHTPASLSYAFNSTQTTQGAILDIPGWLPIIIVAMIGGILLTVVAYFRRQ